MKSKVSLPIMRFFICSLSHVQIFDVSTTQQLQSALSSAAIYGESDVIYLEPGTLNATSIISYKAKDGYGNLRIIGKLGKDSPPILNAK